MQLVIGSDFACRALQTTYNATHRSEKKEDNETIIDTSLSGEVGKIRAVYRAAHVFTGVCAREDLYFLRSRGPSRF